MNSINNILARSAFDIILLQETWLNGRIDSTEIVANTTYQVVRADRSQFINSRIEGGGVVAFIKAGIDYQIIPITTATTIEFVAFRIRLENKFINIINLYIPPYKRRMLSLMNEFKKLMNEVNKLHADGETLICGDFNLSGIQWQHTAENTGNLTPIRASTQAELRFIEEITSSGLHQMNSYPNSKNVFRDLILSTNMTNFQVVLPLAEELIDNFSINHNAFVSVITYDMENDVSNTKSRRRERLNLAATSAAFQNLHLNEPTQTDVDETFFDQPLSLAIKIDIITDRFRHIQESNTVSRNISSHADAPNHPWTTNTKFKALWNRRRQLKKVYMNDPSVTNRTALKTANIEMAALYNTLKESYYNKMIREIHIDRNDRRKFYNFVRTKRISRTGMPTAMQYLGTLYYGNDRFVVLCSFLQSCFRNSSTEFSHDYNIFNEQALDLYRIEYKSTHEALWNQYINWFNIDQVTEAIMSLNDKKDPGPMGITAGFFKHNCLHIAPVLLNIFNVMLETGFVPEQWKNSYLLPIPKMGTLNDVTNYRGIAMQSTISKIFDKLITEKLYLHLSKIIPGCQHGFMPSRSTQSNLLEFMHFAQEAINRGSAVDALYFDFSKAFDRVDFGLLAKKLAALAMPASLFTTLLNFITNRTYQLKTENTVHQLFVRPKSSVPQGSHCGPILYLIYTADITSCVSELNVNQLMYADDTKVFAIVDNIEQMATLQTAADNLFKWSRDNHLDLNSSKTYHMRISKLNSTHIDTHYFIHDKRIQQVPNIKDLGVTFEQHLRFDLHVKNITVTANRLMGMAKRFTYEIHSPKTILALFFTYIVPILEYCAIVWSKIKVKDEKTIEAYLHQATRIALGSAYRPHQPGYLYYGQRLAALKMISMKQRREIAIIMTAINIMKSTEESSLKEFLQQHLRGNHSTRSNRLFNIGTSTRANATPIVTAMLKINENNRHIDITQESRTIKNSLRKAMAAMAHLE